MRRPSREQLHCWDRRLAEDGLPTSGACNRYMFPGGWDDADGTNKHQAHRSLDALGDSIADYQSEFSDDGQQIAAHDTPQALFWDRVGHAANNLPRNYPHRAFLVAVADTGNVRGSARKCRLTERAGEWAWHKFLVTLGLPDPEKHDPQPVRETEPPPAPVRHLSKREIRALDYQPPPKKVA